MRTRRNAGQAGTNTTIDALKGMQADDLAQKRGELRDELAEALERSDGSQLDDAVSARFDEITDAIEWIDEQTERRERAIAQIDTHREADSAGTRSKTSPATQTRDAALRTLERTADNGIVSASTAAGIEKQLKAEGATDLQRYVSLTGDADYLSAFGKLVSSERGHLDLTEPERRAYQRVQSESRAIAEGVNTAGGYLLPFALDPSVILTSNGAVSPLREISRNVQLTAGNSWHGVTSAGVTTQWSAEAATIPDNSPTFAQPGIPVFKGTAFVPYSFEAVEDVPNLYGELSTLVIDGANQLESAAFVTGNGTTQPRGIITALVAASPSVLVNPVTAETFSAADLYALQSALPPRFRQGARWGMNLDILNRARQFETTNGALKFPELANGSLLGRPVSEISALDGTINPAAVENNYSVVYGDFSQFAIVSRIGTVIEPVQNLFDPATGRPTGQRGLLLHWRVGSDVLVPNAFRVLSIPTS